jgi:muramidase (phage lysozyme)
MKRIKKARRYLGFGVGFIILALLAFTQVSIVYSQPIDQIPHQQLHGYLADPSIRAFLDTIAYAEGTLNPEGYNTQYTYKYFTDFSDHPRQINCKMYKGSWLCSTAAGRYQFLEKTWDKIAPRVKAKDFRPINQDLAAIGLLVETNAVPLIIANRFGPAVYKVNNIWASLPGAPYGQPTRSLVELELIFRKQLRYYLKNKELLQKKYATKNIQKNVSYKKSTGKRP